MSFACPDCKRLFKTGPARTHHRWSQHSEIASITLEGKKYAVQRNDGKLNCPVDQCRHSYASREAFGKHVKAMHENISDSSLPSPLPLGLSQFTKNPSPTSTKKGKITHAAGRDYDDEAPSSTPSSAASEEGPLNQTEDVTTYQGNGMDGHTALRCAEEASKASEQHDGHAKAVTEKFLDPEALAAQVSDMLADKVMSNLAAIGLTAENILKLNNLEDPPPPGVTVASLADAVLNKLADFGLTQENIKKLVTLREGVPRRAEGGRSQAPEVSLHLDGNEDAWEFPSPSCPEDSSSSQQSPPRKLHPFETHPTEFSGKRKMAPLHDAADDVKAIKRERRMKEIAVGGSLQRANQSRLRNSARLKRTQHLNKYMPRLQNKCITHFVQNEELIPDDFPCCPYAQNPSLAQGDYKAFRRSFNFPTKFEYCYSCGAPQDQGNNGECPEFHASLTFGKCGFNHVLFRTAFCVWQNTDLRRKMIRDLNIMVSIDSQEDFTMWAQEINAAEGKYHNCSEAFLWFCGRLESRRPLFFV